MPNPSPAKLQTHLLTRNKSGNPKRIPIDRTVRRRSRSKTVTFGGTVRSYPVHQTSTH